MKEIRGHKSWNKDEIIAMLEKNGTFTCCTLPHYRYDRVKSVCRDLQKRGFVRKAGKTETGINLVVTNLFNQWKVEREAGTTTLGPIKWHKARKPTQGDGA